MSKTVECFFDVGSPTAYLACTQLPRIAAECDAQITWRPLLLGGVFKATGNAPPGQVAAKGRWMASDMALWARRYQVPFAMNSHFPINTLTLMRIATGLQLKRPADFDRYLTLVFESMWVHPKNLADAQVLAECLQAGGFDAAALLAMAAESDVKAALIATTEEAVARGVFGAPSFFVGEQLFFGQDRLEFVREALA